MSDQNYSPVVSSNQSKIVNSIIDTLGIRQLPVLGITLNFRAQHIATLSIDVAVTGGLDGIVADELETIQFQLMQPTEQVTEQVTEQAEPQED